MTPMRVGRVHKAHIMHSPEAISHVDQQIVHLLLSKLLLLLTAFLTNDCGYMQIKEMNMKGIFAVDPKQ